MAVYERRYKAYDGSLTPRRWRFLVIPTFALGDVFASKLFTAFSVLCLVWPLILTIAIYLPHNSTFMQAIEAISGGAVSLTFKPSYYLWGFMVPQCFMAFFLTLIIGPAQVSSDLRNNALPLYLSRPFSRSDYVLGKATLLILFLSAITWIPGLLLFSLQAYLEGLDWLQANVRTGAGIVLGSWVWIGVLCSMSLALSAHMRLKPLARAAMFGTFIALAAISGIVNYLFKTEWGDMLNLGRMIAAVWHQLFALPDDTSLPWWSAWVSLASFCCGFLGLLARKVRAYEIVK